MGTNVYEWELKVTVGKILSFIYTLQKLWAQIQDQEKKKKIRTTAAACRYLGAKSVSSCENLTSKRTL